MATLEQAYAAADVIPKEEGRFMPRYVIERNLPGAGKLAAHELEGISRKSCGVLRELARRGGFPADRISEVRSVISPTTAE